MSTHFRVTYATLSADNEQLHTAYEDGLRLATSWLGAHHPRICQRQAAHRRRRSSP